MKITISTCCLIFLNSVTCFNLKAQNIEIPFYTSDKLDLDIMMFQPHRAVYKNFYYLDNEEKLSGYVFIEVDQTQVWTKPTLVVNWSREGLGSTAHDIVWADEDLAIKHRQMPSSGFPSGVILENHYYSNRTDVLFTNPNKVEGLDTMTFSYPKKDEIYNYNKIYSYQKKYRKSHNVIIWPYVISAIDWSEHKDLILPGFSPMGIQEYYYRLIYNGEITINDEKGKEINGFIVSGIRTDSLEKLRNAKLSDQIPRTDYFISKEPPYFLGKDVYTPQESSGKEMHFKEILLGYNLLEYSYRNYLNEMIEESKEQLSGFDMPWNED